MPIRFPRSLSGNPATLARELQDKIDAPVVYWDVTAGAEGTNKRRITLQAKDRVNNPWKERFVCEFWLATASGGSPSATGNTYALVTGTLLQAVTANAHYRVLSDANGVVAFDLTIAGAATRYVATVSETSLVDCSAAIAWAA